MHENVFAILTADKAIAVKDFRRKCLQTPFLDPRLPFSVTVLRSPPESADLVLVEGNPSEHISDIRRCRLVMKNGVLYKSADLYSSVGIKAAD